MTEQNISINNKYQKKGDKTHPLSSGILILEVVIMEKNIYESKSILRLVATFSFPAIFSLLMEIMTSVVDTIFAGHLGTDSVDALTAMGLLAPLLNIFTAIQALYAVSTSILIARHLNNQSERDGYFSTGILCTLLVSMTVSALSYWGTESILHLLGAKQVVFVFAKDYLQIQLLSNIFSALGYTFTSSIRAFGYPKTEMLITALSIVTNIIANVIFAFGLHMGLAGLALGTLFSEIFCMLLALIWLLQKKFLPALRHVEKTKHFSRAWELFRLGFAQTIIQLLGGCTGFFMNHSFMLYGTLHYVAIWNMVQKIYTLFLMPIVGITQGIQTIIAYYSGHQKETQKRETIRCTVVCTMLYGFVALALIFLLGGKILTFFSTSSTLLTQSLTILKIVFLSFPIVGIFYTILTLLEVTGHEIKAIVLTLSRQVFLLLPLVSLLPKLLPQYNNAIFCAVPMTDLFVLIIAAIITIKTIKSKSSVNK